MPRLNTGFVTVGSVTYAIKARKILSAAGITTAMKKISGSRTGKRGCVYGIEFSANRLYDVMRVLRENNIKYEIYQDENI